MEAEHNVEANQGQKQEMPRHCQIDDFYFYYELYKFPGMSTFDVRLGGLEGGLRGSLQLGTDGLSWKSQNGERKISVNRADAESAEWLRTGPKNFQFRIRQSDNVHYRFDGFDERDQKIIQNFCKETLSIPFKIEKLDVQGKNGGKFECLNDELVFKVFTTGKGGEVVSAKKAFDISLSAVKNAQANATKDEILLEFSHAENSAGRRNECALTEMRFYVPNTTTDDDDDGRKTVEILHSDIMKHVVMEATGAQIAKLESVKCKYPRNTFEIALYDSVLKMHGQSYDFSIKYKNISRLLLVPNPMNQVYLVICLIEPERKGGTQYNAIVAIFDPEEEADISLTLPSDFNSRYKDHKNKELIRPKMSGKYHETVCTLLQFFSSTPTKPMRVHRAGKFKAQQQRDQSGQAICCVKCSVAANTGFLYLLDNCFVFLEKPPLIFMYENVDSIFWDVKTGIAQSTSLSLKIKLDNKKAQEFNTIPKVEVKNMNAFFEAICKQKYEGKKMVIANYDDEADDDEGDRSDEDKHIKHRIQADAEEGSESSEDEDFRGSEASSSESSSSSSEGESEDADRKPAKDKPAKPAKSKREGSPKAKPKKKAKGSEDEGGSSDDGVKAGGAKKDKPKRAKKDPNAPKKAKSAWLLFCDAMRDKVKEETPGIGFTEINAVISKKWNALSEEQKRPYDEKAKQLGERYREEKARYDREHPGEGGGGGGKKRKGDGGEGKEGKRRGKREKKDPNAPKGPQNAFMLFSNAVRDKIRKENPSLATKDIARETGTKWKALGAEERKEWDDKARADKLRFQREQDAFLKEGKTKVSAEEFARMADDGDDASGDASDASD